MPFMQTANLRYTVPVLALLLAVGCAHEPVKSRWIGSDLSVDGRGGDWSTVALHYHDKMKLSYGIVNDQNCLYVMIIVRDRHTERMINHRGLTVWFEADGGREKDFGIRYAGGKHSFRTFSGIAEEGRSPMHDPGMMRPPEPPPEPKGTFSLLTGRDTPRIIPEGGMQGVQAAAEKKGGVTCFELEIPLSCDPGRGFAFCAMPGSKVEVGFEIEAVSPEEREAIMAKMKKAAGRRGGGGGRGGGGMRGGMGSKGPPGGMPDGGRQALMKTLDAQEFWVEVTLAEGETSS